MIRLQKYMADAGVASRRASEEIILGGRVKVNGAVVRELGTKVEEGRDRVEVDGKLIRPAGKLYYIMLNKPRGYVTTAKDQFDRPAVLDLVGDISARIYPVGRLDYDSSGLLFLTNDGDFANRLMHPKHGVEKTYRVQARGHFSKDELSKLRRGVELDTGKTGPAKAEIVREKENSSELMLTIREGKNRQVRKMCEAVGHGVLSLERVAEGGVSLGNLPSGKWRHLTEAEINRLKKG